MSSISTKFIILESFYCVGRPHLLSCPRAKSICNFTVCVASAVITALLITDIISSENSIGLQMFQFLSTVELCLLAIGARYTEISNKVMKKLELNYQLSAICETKLNWKMHKVILFSIVSFLCDIIALKLLKLKITTAIFLGVVFAAHDCECEFLSLLVETMNIRLDMFKSASIPPIIGSRFYGFLLMASAHLSYHYIRFLPLLLGSTLITTVIYQFILITADNEMILYLSLYLIWREFRSMYSLITMCNTLARSDALCKELELFLIGKLTTDKNMTKERNLKQYKILERWYSRVTMQKPRYISGSIFSIGLNTPILVLDLSINYMLIIVQMYLAYK